MYWFANDTEPDLAGSVGVDLTGSTATVHVRTPAGTLLTRAAVAAEGSTGAWSMPWQVGDLATSGVYDVQVEVVAADGGVRTFACSGIRVKAALDGTGAPFVAPLTIVDNGDGTSTVTWS